MATFDAGWTGWRMKRAYLLMIWFEAVTGSDPNASRLLQQPWLSDNSKNPCILASCAADLWPGLTQRMWSARWNLLQSPCKYRNQRSWSKELWWTTHQSQPQKKTPDWSQWYSGWRRLLLCWVKLRMEPPGPYVWRQQPTQRRHPDQCQLARTAMCDSIICKQCWIFFIKCKVSFKQDNPRNLKCLEYRDKWDGHVRVDR